MNLQPRFVDCKLLGRRPAFPRLRQLLRSSTRRWFDNLVTQRPEGTGPGGRGAMPSRNLKGDGHFVAIFRWFGRCRLWFLSVLSAQFRRNFSLISTARFCAYATEKFQEEPVVADQVLKDSLEKIADSGLVAKSSTQLVKWQAKKKRLIADVQSWRPKVFTVFVNTEDRKEDTAETHHSNCQQTCLAQTLQGRRFASNMDSWMCRVRLAPDILIFMTGMATSFPRKVRAGFILVGLRRFREVAATISEPGVSVDWKAHVDRTANSSFV